MIDTLYGIKSRDERFVVKALPAFRACRMAAFRKELQECLLTAAPSTSLGGRVRLIFFSSLKFFYPFETRADFHRIQNHTHGHKVGIILGINRLLSHSCCEGLKPET